MKTVFKYIVAILVGVLLLIITFANFWQANNTYNVVDSRTQDKYKRSVVTSNFIEKTVEEMNRYCPIEYEYGSMDSVFIEDKKVVYKMSISNKSVQFNSFNEQAQIVPLSKDFLRKTNREQLLHYYLIVRKDKENPFNEELINRGYSQEWRMYMNKKSSKYTAYTMTPQEMKEIRDFCEKYPKRAKQQFFKEYIDRQNELLKNINYENATVSLFTDNTSLYYIYTLSKDITINNKYCIKNLKTNEEEVWTSIVSDLRTVPLFHSVQEICLLMNKKLIFRYKDFFEKDSIDFIMPLNDAEQDAMKHLPKSK